MLELLEVGEKRQKRRMDVMFAAFVEVESSSMIRLFSIRFSYPAK